MDGSGAIVKTRRIQLFLLYPNELANIIASTGAFDKEGFFHASLHWGVRERTQKYFALLLSDKIY